MCSELWVTVPCAALGSVGQFCVFISSLSALAGAGGRCWLLAGWDQRMLRAGGATGLCQALWGHEGHQPLPPASLSLQCWWDQLTVLSPN